MASASYSLPFFLLPLLLSPLLTTAQQTSLNIASGYSFSTDDENSSLVSPSGDFAFGFHRLPSTNTFLLAVWFNKIPEKTLVWYSNGSNPVQQGSTLELNNDGRLILTDRGGGVAWRTAPLGRIVAFASMLDTGSFALMNANSEVVWETFQEPTNTILPSQILDMGTDLYSHLTDTNYSVGRFVLRVQADGNLVMYPVDLLTGSPIQYSYWSTGTVGSGSQLVFNESSGSIYFTLRNGSRVSISSANVSTKDYYHRATLDIDGGFRHYIYPKNRTASWAIVKAIPDSMCTALATKLGGGMCGYNSFCEEDEDGRPNCSCLFGYSHMDPEIRGLGCKPDFALQDCLLDHEKRRFELKEITDWNWPEGDFEMHQPMSEEQCKEDCLNDCLCALAIFNDDAQCWKKNLPVVNGRVEVGARAFIKVQTGNFSLGTGEETGREKEKDEGTWLFGVLLGVSGFLNLGLVVAATVVLFYYASKKTRTVAVSDPGVSGTNLPSFTYKELIQMTNGFREEIGCGAFGTVFKGAIGGDSRVLVAVKKLNKLTKDGEKEFTAEVNSIGRTHHRNLVQLLGFCDEGQNRLLVYEFMSNGSLASFLFGGSRPEWNLRMQIAYGIARGLMYLHEDCETQIIHCDIKPHNILVDEHFAARISDFGLAKLLKTDHSRTYTSIRGTRGYVAPEWFRKGAVSANVDVYSFGVVMLEIICCRKHVDPEAGNECKVILTDWVYDCYREGMLGELVEGDAEALSDLQRLERAVITAIWCIQEDPSLRPSMKTVTQMLEGTIQICAPPNPSSFFSSIERSMQSQRVV